MNNQLASLASQFEEFKRSDNPSASKNSHLLSQEQGMSAPVSQTRTQPSEGELSDEESSLPASKRHRSKSPQGDSDFHSQELDPSYVEMLNAIRGLLDLEVPQVECLVAPSAFSKKPSKQVVRKQHLALPPVEDIQSMWDYRFRKASGTTVKDKSSSESLSQGQFLAFERPDMIYYTTFLQNTPLKAPKLPDSYFNIARVKSLSNSISVPSKQHIVQETVCRENVQILGHVVWFKMAIEELNNRIQELATEIRGSGIKESADLVIKYSQLQASVTSSLEIALDTVLKQNMTLACNMLLARRDSLLKDWSSKLGPKDLANLRTDHFDQQEVFNSDILSQVEDNMIKRLSIMKYSHSKSHRDSVKNFDFGRSSHPKPSQEGNRFRDKQTQPNTSYNHFSARASRGGRGGKRKWLSRDKIAGFLAGMGKKSSTSQSSKFTTTWLSPRLQNSTQIVENSAHFEQISQQKQRWRSPRSGSGHACKKGDDSCQETLHSGILQKTISGTQTHETMETSDRFHLSMLNNHLHVPTFKMETAESIRKSIQKGEWVTSIDLTDAYFHVPIHPQSQKYLRFQTKKGVFQFQALPFGVATAPLEFTRIVKEVNS